MEPAFFLKSASIVSSVWRAPAMSKRRNEEPCRAGDIKRQRLEEFSGK